ncbi:hypothetical protein SEPCBS57363_001272 [Sporothrix epigloea]|uniref:Uncharacterized protein n=1 Tax=Sporothrix epigloea TaxID=1892477 RepID=A0ABP0D998_9PEZI
MSQYLASLEELRRAENENDEDDTCRSSSPPRTIAQNPEPATLGRAFPLDSAPISDKHHQVSANFTSIEADDYLAAVGKRKVNWVECGNFPYGSDCTTGCANGGEATEFSGHGHESHLNGDCEAALDSSWYRESTRQAGAVHIDSDYRKRLPSLQQAGLVAQQEVLLNKAMYSGRVAAESSPDASNAQDHSAVPLSMRVSFDPGVIHEHSDSALMRTCENWPATAATSSQVRASEFPAARFYAQPVALGRPEHLKSDFETLRRMPLQTTRQSWSHTPPPKPYQIQKTTNGTRDMGISSWHDLDTLSDSSRWQPLPVESGLRDYATVIHEIETRDRARRCMLEGYAAYQLCVARTRAAESNQPLYRSQSFACSRNQESRYARDVTLPHFGRDMICDGITKSAARLSTTRQPAMTQPPVDDLPAKLASMDKPITGLATIQQRQDKAEEARMSGTQPEKASFDKAAAPASGRQDAFLPEQASAAASVHDASHNVTRLTSVTLRRPAWALELTARAARANSVSRS